MNILLIRRTITEEMQPKPHVVDHWETYELTLPSNVDVANFVASIEPHPAIKDVKANPLLAKVSISLSLLQLPPAYGISSAGAKDFLKDIEAKKASFILPDDPAQGHKECSQCRNVSWDSEGEHIGAAKRWYCPECAAKVKSASL